MNRRAREDPDDSLEKLRRQPAPEWVQLGHCVYVLNVVDKSGVLKHKIGRSIDLQQRWAKLRHEIRGHLEIVHQRMVPEHVYMEACAHALLRELRLDNEIEMFAADIELVLGTLNICSSNLARMQQEHAELKQRVEASKLSNRSN